MPETGANITLGRCLASGHGTRIIPQGTIHSAHYLETPHYTQITGTGSLTSLNIQSGDAGGELGELEDARYLKRLDPNPFFRMII